MATAERRENGVQEIQRPVAKGAINIQTGLHQLDDVVGKRTRAIEKKLHGVEEAVAPEKTLLTDIQDEIPSLEG